VGRMATAKLRKELEFRNLDTSVHLISITVIPCSASQG
jgi:hypothetical protein